MAKNRELTEREREILELVATGASNRQIAQQLHISSNTVKVHLRNIFEKLGVSSRTEATLYAIQAGMVDGVESTLVTTARPWWQRGWVVGGGVFVLMMVALLIGLLVNRGGPPPENLVDLEQLERDRWQELAPMPTARKGLAVAAYDGKIYAIAGETADGVTNVVERYDPITDSWETMAPKPTAVTDVQAAVIGGKIYVPGGTSGFGSPLNILEVFDPSIGEWEKRNPIPVQVSSYGLTSFQGDLYLFGGWDGKTVLDIALRYEPTSDMWKDLTRMISPVSDASATSTSLGIFVIGGLYKGQVLKNNYLFTSSSDASVGSWVQFKPIPEFYIGGGVITIADIVHVIAGDDGNNECRFYKFFVHRDQWECQEVPDILIMSDFGITELDNKIYIIGGASNSMVLSEALSYRAIYSILLPLIN